jgi:uncharacterized membrane protein YhaH (DUF805 family)
MGPVTALRSFYGRYFDVYGRSRRFEYFWNLFIQTIGIILGMILIVVSEGSHDGLESGDLNLFSKSILVIIALWSVASIVPWITLQVRRFHDMGYTGWMVALFVGLWFIPIIGSIGWIVQFFWLLFGSGTAGLNQYGQDPRFSAAGTFA